MSEPLDQALTALFPAEDAATARRLLDAYGTASFPQDRERVQLAALSLCGGDIDELRRLVDRARRDYRDVLYWQQLAAGYVDPLADRLLQSGLEAALTPRRLELLRESVPTLARVAVLSNPSNAFHPPQTAALAARAAELGVAVVPVAAQRPGDFPAAFATMQHEGVDGLVILASPLHQYHLRTLAALALDVGAASICELGRYARLGGLLSYGPSAASQATKTVRSLRGALGVPVAASSEASASPALVVNLTTARRLGLTLSPGLLQQASATVG